MSMNKVRNIKCKMINNFGRSFSWNACMSIPFFNFFIILPAPGKNPDIRSCMVQTYGSMEA